MTNDPVEQSFAPLGDDLARRAAHYVRTGEDEAVLAALKARAPAPDAPPAAGWIKLPSAESVASIAIDDAGADPAPQVSAGALWRLGVAWVSAHQSRSFVAELEGEHAWIETVVWATTSVSPYSTTTVTTSLSADLLAQTMADAGADPARLAEIVCRTAQGEADGATFQDQFARRNFVDALLAMKGMGALFGRHAAIVKASLAAAKASIRVTILQDLKTASLPLDTCLTELAELAIAPQKGVAAAAIALLATDPETARGAIKPHLASKKVGERALAVQALVALGETDVSLFRARLEIETSEPVKEALEQAIASRSGASADAALANDSRPETGSNAVPALGEDAFAAFRAFADDWHPRALEAYASHRAIYPAFQKPPPAPLSDRTLREVLAAVSDPEPWTEEPALSLQHLVEWPLVDGHERLADLAWAAPFSLVHAVRLLMLAEPGARGLYLVDRLLTAKAAKTNTRYDLRDVAAAVTMAGMDGRQVALGTLSRMFVWGDAAVGALLESMPEVLESALGFRTIEGLAVPSYSRDDVRRSAFKRLGRMARVPAAIEAPLLRAALDGPRRERGIAQRAAERIPDWKSRVLAALADRSQDVRSEAATWLARARAFGAREAIGAAFAKEKKDVARAAMLDALDVLGEPLEKFVDRGAWLADSEKLLRATPSPAWIVLPAVRWSASVRAGKTTDTGEVVPEAIVRGWIAAAWKAKSPAGSALLRAYGQFLNADDREALALAVLRAFVAHDTDPPKDVSPAAEKELRSQAEMYASFGGITEEEAYTKVRAAYLASPAGSAIADKGVLAVVASFGGRGIAEVVGAYLKTWYGMRAAQCKALVQMLAYVDDGSAIQLLLATATRFRTAGIRAEAEAQVTALSERRGWTVSELADRTLPSADLDETGALTLSFGPRSFEARLDDRLALVLRDDKGQTLKALPEPRKDDDEAAAKAAKTDFARSKKAITTIVKAQTERLYGAMCTQSTWRFADWHTYLAKHPIMSRLCARLVWLSGPLPEQGERADTGDESTSSPVVDVPRIAFRPLGDGSLSTVDHGNHAPPPDAIVTLAHATLLSPEAIAEWQAHFGDFEVLPLFPQLTRPTFALDESLAQATSLETHRGHMLDSFVLRSGATRLGYARGPAEDGGWFYEYRKTFPALGLDVVLAFSGSAMPEENKPVALKGVSFVSREGGASPLGSVPRVLLSEAWADVAELAGLGKGLDPDWESKVA